jgi:hypothetical protein
LFTLDGSVASLVVCFHLSGCKLYATFQSHHYFSRLQFIGLFTYWRLVFISKPDDKGLYLAGRLD